MKNLLKLNGAKALNSTELKSISGGRRKNGPSCPAGGDPECCGNNFWQCGTGIGAGGILMGETCACF